MYAKLRGGCSNYILRERICFPNLNKNKKRGEEAHRAQNDSRLSDCKDPHALFRFTHTTGGPRCGGALSRSRLGDSAGFLKPSPFERVGGDRTG